MKLNKYLLTVILLLVSGQVRAGIISDANALPGAELWKYSVRGSVSNDLDGVLDISGSMLIDTTVREWSAPYSPRSEPCSVCDSLLHILAFDLRIGDLSFFGEGPWSNSGGGSGLYFYSEEEPSGTFGYYGDWFLEGDGDYSLWYGQEHGAFNADGSLANLEDFFQEVPPPFIEMKLGFVATDPYDDVYMHLTRVARVPEPQALLLFGVGMIGLIGFRKRRKVA